MSVKYVKIAGVDFGIGCFKGWKEERFIEYYEKQKPFKDLDPLPREAVLKEAFKAVQIKTKGD